MIELNKHEYYRCFDKWKLRQEDTENTYAMFDWYEMYPMIFAITPLKIRIQQRIDFFKSDCRNEIDRIYEGEDNQKFIKYKIEEFPDSYLLSCFWKDNLYKHIKLQKNNKVDFTYEYAVYSNNEIDYKENLLDRMLESIDAISNVTNDLVLQFN